MTTDSQPVLAEYENNPFIEALPPIQTLRGIIDSMALPPHFNDAERNYPPHVRYHCVGRLAHYFEPLSRHAELAQRLDLILRRGYVGRNPTTHDYIRHLQNGAQRVESNDLNVSPLHPVQNTALSFALIGCSGIGKSTSMERVLHLYPQYITHETPFSLVQVTWLRLDCPSKASAKALCTAFFAEMDRLLGTNYLAMYGNTRASENQMLVHMAQVANLHALGVLVIDEIQHLIGMKSESEILLNFLVTLVNTISVPVILIGTLGAQPLLQKNFRQARRASGFGDLTWFNLQPGTEWNHFADRLWRFQWLPEPGEATDEFRAALYEESQGILDIAVKIFILAQLRCLKIEEVRRTHTKITPSLIKQVGREDFKLVQPMLDALRKNDRRALLKYDDLMPLQAYIEQRMTQALQTPVAVPDIPPSKPRTTLAEPGDPVGAAMQSLGIAQDVAGPLLAEARQAVVSEDPLQLTAWVIEKLKASPPKRRKKRRRKVPLSECPADDLRRIVEAGKQQDLPPYEALFSAGVIRPPLADFGG